MHRIVTGLFLAAFAAGACNSAPDHTPGAASLAAEHEAAVPTTGSGTPADNTPTPAPRPLPVDREITIPEGTELPIVLDTNVASKTSHVEDPVRAHLSRAVTIDGTTVLHEGSLITGVVTDATPAAKVKGRAHLAVRFDSITPRGSDERYRIQTASVARTAPATKKEDAVKVGAPAAGGAIIGAIIGGGKGAAIGAAAGGGAGTAVVLSTAGKETTLPVGSALRLRLSAPLTVRIRG